MILLSRHQFQNEFDKIRSSSNSPPPFEFWWKWFAYLRHIHTLQRQQSGATETTLSDRFLYGRVTAAAQVSCIIYILEVRWYYILYTYYYSNNIYEHTFLHIFPVDHDYTGEKNKDLRPRGKRQRDRSFEDDEDITDWGQKNGYVFPGLIKNLYHKKPYS